MSCNSMTSISIRPFGDVNWHEFVDAAEAAFTPRFHCNEGFQTETSGNEKSLELVYYDGWEVDQLDCLSKGLEKLSDRYPVSELAVEFSYIGYDESPIDDGNGYRLRIERGKVVESVESVISWEPSVWQLTHLVGKVSGPVVVGGDGK